MPVSIGPPLVADEVQAVVQPVRPRNDGDDGPVERGTKDRDDFFHNDAGLEPRQGGVPGPGGHKNRPWVLSGIPSDQAPELRSCAFKGSEQRPGIYVIRGLQLTEEFIRNITGPAGQEYMASDSWHMGTLNIDVEDSHGMIVLKSVDGVYQGG